VHIDLPIEVVFDPDTFAGCEGAGIAIAAPISVATYHWFNVNEELVGEDATLMLDSLTAASAGLYSLAAATTFGCRDTATYALAVQPMPAFEASLSQPTCADRNDGTLHIAPFGGQILTATLFGMANESLTWDTLGVGTYTVLLLNEFNCHAAYSFTMSPPPHPVDTALVATAWSDNSDGSISLVLNPDYAPYTVAWNGGNYEGAHIENIPTGTYQALIEDLTQCPYEASYFVDNQGFFTAVLTPDSVTIDQYYSTQLLVTTTPATAGLSYQWQTAPGLSCTDCPDPVASPLNSTTYIVLVTSEKGCFSSDSVYVEVIIPPSRPFMPTVFSPNGDGLNDALCVLSDRIVQLQLEIFNRWGEREFAAQAPGQCWDGTHKGQPVNPGVFVYSLQLALEDGEVVQETGYLQVIR
jgi:gliding motility-associated-like protein